MSKTHVARIALWLGALACLSVSLHFMYQAGCAGDLKTGSLGDLPRALEIETTGVLFALLGIGFAGAAASLHPRLALPHRFAAVLGAMFLGLVLFTYFGVTAEVRGVQRCLAEK